MPTRQLVFCLWIPHRGLSTIHRVKVCFITVVGNDLVIVHWNIEVSGLW